MGKLCGSSEQIDDGIGGAVCGQQKRGNMNKADYMKNLRERLERFSQELQDEILEDYEQHFAEGEKQGKSEEEIVRELGNIEEMIQELSDVDVESGKESTDGAAGEAVPTGIVESGSAVTEQNYTYDGRYEVIELEGAMANLLLEPSEDGKLHIEYRNDLEEKYRQLCSFYYYEKNGVFHAGVKVREAERKVKFFGRILTMSGSFSWGEDDLLLQVKVPSEMPRLSFATSSGDVRMDGISVGNLQGKTASGDVKVMGVMTEELHISATSGDLELEDVKVKKADLSTTSGDVDIEGTKAEKIHVNTGSGDIEIAGGTDIATGEFITASGDIEADVCADTVTFSTASGDIEANAGARVVTCNSTSGDIHAVMTRPYKQANQNEPGCVIKCNTTSGDINAITSGNPIQADMNSVSGDIRLDMELLSGMETTVNTVSGDIGIRWQGRRQKVGRGSYRFGDGSSKVKVNTVSGDIEIDGQ